jgi:hypothetical protein
VNTNVFENFAGRSVQLVVDRFGSDQPILGTVDGRIAEETGAC